MLDFDNEMSNDEYWEYLFTTAEAELPPEELNEVKSNLEQEYGLFYTTVNVGAYKEIRIEKKKH